MAVARRGATRHWAKARIAGEVDEPARWTTRREAKRRARSARQVSARPAVWVEERAGVTQTKATRPGPLEEPLPSDPGALLALAARPYTSVASLFAARYRVCDQASAELKALSIPGLQSSRVFRKYRPLATP